MGSVGQTSTISEHGTWPCCISDGIDSSALELFVSSAMKNIYFTISRCILEILNCALYLCRQGGDFGAGSVISILTTCDFSLNKHPLVKQALVNSQQEGKVNNHPQVKQALVNSQQEGNVKKHPLVKQALVNSQQEGKANKRRLVKQASVNSHRQPVVKQALMNRKQEGKANKRPLVIKPW